MLLIRRVPALVGAVCSLIWRSGDAPAGRITHLTDLATPRSAHTATALPSRAVLVVGGMNQNGGGLASVELVDLDAARVTPLSPLRYPRAGHTATALPDGRVVIAGGYNGDYLSSVEMYDPVTRRFTALGELVEGRSEHTATLLPDGTILLVGGVGRGWTFLASAEVFDPATGRAAPVGSLDVPRESHTATLLTDGRVLVVGGHRGRRAAMEVYASAELYDPTTRRFRSAGRLTTARHKHDAVRLADGRVLVLGGADRTDRHYFTSTELYDPATGRFTAGPTMTYSRYKMQGTAVRLPDGDVLIASGARTAERLDAAARAFHAVPGDFPRAYYFATATLLPSGVVAIIGGYDARNRDTPGVWRFEAAP